MPTVIPRLPKSTPTPSSEPLAVSATEAARLLSVSEKTLRTWTAQGKITARRVGGRVLYSVKQLRLLIDGDDSTIDSE